MSLLKSIIKFFSKEKEKPIKKNSNPYPKLDHFGELLRIDEEMRKQ